MTLISSIITDAFREGNILPLGVEPNANQSAEALRLLNSIFTTSYGDEAGEPLQDWPLGNFGREIAVSLIQDIDRPYLNRRLIAVNDAAQTVYFSAMPQDGARMGIIDPFGRLASVPITIDANGRTIEAAATLTVNTNGTMAEWLYRADLGDWVLLTPKLATDEMPFPTDFDTYFITCLAMRINPRYGRTMDEQSAVTYKSERRKFIARYLQSMPREMNDDISWPFMSRQSYDRSRTFSNQRDFNRGSWGW